MRGWIDGRGLGIAAIVVSSALWATTGTAATFAPGVGPLAIGAAALGIGGLLQGIVELRSVVRQRRAVWARRWWVLLGAAGVAVYPLAFYTSMHLAGVAIGTVVSLGSAPIASGLLERIIDGVRLSRWWMLAAGLGVLGSVLLCVAKLGATSAGAASSASAALLGVGLGLVAGLSYAVYAWVVARLMAGESVPVSADAARGADTTRSADAARDAGDARGEGVAARDADAARGAGAARGAEFSNAAALTRGAAMGSVFGLGGVLLMPVLVVTGAPLLASGTNLVVGAYMALVPMFTGYLLFGFALTRVPASTATSITLLEPALATLLAIFIVGERLSPIGWTGLGVLGLVLLILAIAPTSVGGEANGAGGRAIGAGGGANGDGASRGASTDPSRADVPLDAPATADALNNSVPSAAM